MRHRGQQHYWYIGKKVIRNVFQGFILGSSYIKLFTEHQLMCRQSDIGVADTSGNLPLTPTENLPLWRIVFSYFMYRRPTLYTLQIAVDFLKSL